MITEEQKSRIEILKSEFGMRKLSITKDTLFTIYMDKLDEDIFKSVELEFSNPEFFMFNYNENKSKRIHILKWEGGLMYISLLFVLCFNDIEFNLFIDYLRRIKYLHELKRELTKYL